MRLALTHSQGYDRASIYSSFVSVLLLYRGDFKCVVYIVLSLSAVDAHRRHLIKFVEFNLTVE